MRKIVKNRVLKEVLRVMNPNLRKHYISNDLWKLAKVKEKSIFYFLWGIVYIIFIFGFFLLPLYFVKDNLRIHEREILIVNLAFILVGFTLISMIPFILYEINLKKRLEERYKILKR